jgi:hypothetical protein
MAKKKRDALVWGVILILDNFDIDVWDYVARLWPVALIVWGAWKLYFGIKERKEQAEVPEEKRG